MRVIFVCCLVAMSVLTVAGVSLLRQPVQPFADPRPATSPAAGTPTSSPTSTQTEPPKPTEWVLDDGFHVRRLANGERPPQFILVSFDGAGWDAMWDFWFRVQQQVPFRFTGFLSGTYLLSYDTRDAYHPPYYPPGTSEIGWYSADDLPVEIANLNRALAAGNEIGTHFNGHFCVGAGLPSGGNSWTTADWDTELDQFFKLVRDYGTNNDVSPSARLNLRPSDIRGVRTPCLEGLPDELYPALKAHGLRYDSSFSRSGLSWPTLSPEGIWQIGMALFPMHGELPDGRVGVPVTTMDYNFWFTQRGAVDASPADAAQDEQQVLDTYRDMYAAAYRGNRAPLVLGNHFNDWNHAAYRDALATFVKETCGRAQTECVTYSDLVAWMQAQSPRTLHRLQRLEPEYG